MNKTISVCYPYSKDDTFFVSVTYHIDSCDENVTAIRCLVEEMPPKVVPGWLRTRKFDATARLAHGSYTMLYNDSHYAYGLHTSLFIETATRQIMMQERMRKAS